MTAKTIYVVTAHRWGERDTHQYIVCASLNEARAKTRAKEECDERGGKYATRVMAMADGVLMWTGESKIVAFYPSSRYPDARELVTLWKGEPIKQG